MPVETDILPPRYRDPERIGYGGMGEIYRAKDSTLGRDVAVKLLSERYARDEAVRLRFTREALAAARLSGEPHTVTIFDVGEWNERPFIVMEHLAGGSLEERLAKRGRVEPDQALKWLGQAAAALDAAHRNGVVHRDVKPGNLLLDRGGDVHVADFGIASAAGMDSLTMTGTVLGTAGYLAPEQAAGERATAASDRYALGVVAYELLTGTRPFESKSVTAEAAAHLHSEVPPVAERNPELPPALDQVFARALAKDPEQRYPTAAELVADLGRALADSAGTTRRLAPVPRRERRDRTRLMVLAALLVAAGTGGAILAAILSGGDGTASPSRPRVSVKTVTAEGTTVRETVTAKAPTAEPATGLSGAALNDAGYRKQQAGDYAGALPLLEQAVQKLRGSRSITEAYASYNLAYTRLQLGRCDGVVELLDRSESIQGHRKEIDKARKQAKKQC